MIKSFSGQVVFCFASPEPYLLTLAKNQLSQYIYEWKFGKGEWK